MKLRITLPAIAVIAAAAIVIAVFAPLFSACDDRLLPPVTELALLSVRAGDMDVSAIPTPIEEKDWNNEEYEPANSDSGVIVVKDWNKENVYFDAKANVASAVITWGRSKGGTRPVRFNDLRQPTALEEDDLFFFRVADPETKETKYYRFFPSDARNVKILVNLTVAGRGPNKIPKEVSGMAELANLIMNGDYRGQIDITRREAVRALVAATPQDAVARVRYAVAQNITQAAAGNFSAFEVEVEEGEEDQGDEESKPKVVVIQDEQGKNITQTHGILNFEDGNILAVEVTAQNDDVNYYGFIVYSGRLATINKLTIGGKVVAGKGTEHFAWDNVVPGSFASADQPTAGFKINIQLEDSDGTYEWVRRTKTQGEPASGLFSDAKDPIVRFEHENFLVLRVHSARANTNDNRYYKIQVNLLAANFKKHPKSAAYEITSYTYPTTAVEVVVDDEPAIQNRILTTVTGDRTLDRAIESLSVILDRTGNFSYQWYTANSWYGGYGFDQDSNIAFDPDVHEDGGDNYNPVTNDILDKAYFPNPFAPDEKGNISFHNGGNQYYRLPYMGKPIPADQGGTAATYTPTIDARNRPFITGFSNQTQYYWVVVTDIAQGLKATSDRAAIVAEWGEEFNMGVPTGKSVLPKKHHIVDMHAYMDSSVGLKSNPRNPTAFKAGNHGDQYLIPITFPSGFNVNDYKVVTCQALFYLSDGRPWIQNWTQGDFGFADSAGDRLVLWYNLTNDNATRGLDGTGNEPASSGLDVKPAYLIVQPAGTKPMNTLPPFEGTDRDGRDKPKANNDAQGWFTPYIEIVELRFEGPKR